MSIEPNETKMDDRTLKPNANLQPSKDVSSSTNNRGAFIAGFFMGVIFTLMIGGGICFILLN